jgi:GT2 family glycosyltransferase
MTEFQNATGHPIWLPGPNGEKTQFNKFERKPLDDYYKKYVPRYLRMIIMAPLLQPQTQPQTQQPRTQPRMQQMIHNRSVKVQPIPKVPRTIIIPQIMAGGPYRTPGEIPGRIGIPHAQATIYLNQLVQRTSISISNDVGVGILSYNRLASLQRLVESIRKYTDLLQTTVFISDESTDPAVKEYLKTIQDMCVLENMERLGVSGNSNRLLRCLERFRYKLLLNDDVEILNSGWENLYISSSKTTGIHHFCMRQPGVYGATATEGTIADISSVKVQTITEKPHGAVMFFDNKAFKTVGYFDEALFGLYGMEHVDWSNRVSLSKIQLPGFHDVVNSTAFFKIHHEKSAVAERHLYQSAKMKYQEVKANASRLNVQPSAKSAVPSVSYVIPFRGLDRKECVKTVLQNVKAQHYPIIEIIMSEQDSQTLIQMPEFDTITYVLAQTPAGQAFSKSVAFNVGVSKVTNNRIILHDADMIVYNGYTLEMARLLDKYEGVHIGKSVLYLSQAVTDVLNKTGKLTPQADRSVQYFEGGSLGCRKDVYIRIGGFNEIFVGYGQEDLEFYERLKMQSFFGERSIDLIHLWHGRTHGWEIHHTRNKQVGRQLQAVPMARRIFELNKQFVTKYGKE